MSKDEKYEVGYGRPPKEHQFKPGVSGNSKGRPRGAENIQAVIKKQLAKRVKVKERGRVRSVTKAEAFIGGIIDRAILGNPRYSQQALSLLRIEGVSVAEDGSMQIEIKFVSPDGSVRSDEPPEPADGDGGSGADDEGDDKD